MTIKKITIILFVFLGILTLLHFSFINTVKIERSSNNESFKTFKLDSLKLYSNKIAITYKTYPYYNYFIINFVENLSEVDSMIIVKSDLNKKDLNHVITINKFFDNLTIHDIDDRDYRNLFYYFILYKNGKIIYKEEILIIKPYFLDFNDITVFDLENDSKLILYNNKSVQNDSLIAFNALGNIVYDLNKVSKISSENVSYIILNDIDTELVSYIQNLEKTIKLY
jgi:hypothetical protein